MESITRCQALGTLGGVLPGEALTLPVAAKLGGLQCWPPQTARRTG
jgi:hypothetical protein